MTDLMTPQKLMEKPLPHFQFHYGYYDDLHPDCGVNFQMNRWINYLGSDALKDMREIAPRLSDYPSYIREFITMGDKALKEGRKLHAAFYYRSAEFFMWSDNPEKKAMRQKFLRLAREVWGLQDSDRYRIPYEQDGRQVFLPAYRFMPETPKSTIVIFGGSDSYIEEFFPILFVMRDMGYDVVCFDGPGQGELLVEEGLPMIPDWHKPVKAVLDYFNLSDVTLMGISFGGCLVLRAAAYEPRVKRAVACDICFDTFSLWLEKIPPVKRAFLKALYKWNAASIYNALMGRAMKNSLVIDWGVRHGMYIVGAKTPFEHLKMSATYNNEDISLLVKQDVLLLAGTEDFGIPIKQFYQQIEALKNVRSLTARMFTRAEQAQNHCQVGNLGLLLDVVLNWVDQTCRSYK